MEVVVFAQEEKQTLIDQPANWKEKVEALGLTGQLELTNEKTEAPNPFLRMDARLINILRTCCSATSELDDFNKEPIPMQVLGTIALCRERQWFESMEVWYSPGHPDPLLIGKTKQPTKWGSETVLWLLAQWGPERVTFDQLAARAKEIYKAKISREINACMAKLKGAAENADILAEEFVTGGSGFSCYVNI